MATTNIVKACYAGFRELTTRELVQYDYGQILQITNFDLPEAYEAVFSNTKTGPGKSQIGSADGVPIPDEYLTTGLPIYVKLFLHEGEDDGEAPLLITIPVIKSTYDSTDPPTPVEQSAITQAIAALQSAVSETAENVSLSAGYAEEAEDYKDAAQGYASDAQGYASSASSDAQSAHSDAEEAKTQADIAVTQAGIATDEANRAKNEADDAEYWAHLSEQGAGTAGFIDVEIDEHGHLIYYKTPTVDVDFYLDDGHLIMEVPLG